MTIEKYRVVVKQNVSVKVETSLKDGYRWIPLYTTTQWVYSRDLAERLRDTLGGVLSGAVIEIGKEEV